MTHRIFMQVIVLASLAAVHAPADEPKAADLAKARIEAAREAYEGTLVLRASLPQHAPLESLYTWSRRWMEASQAVATDRAGRLVAVQGHLERMRKVETVTADQRKTGFATSHEVSAARYFRIEAELWLVELGMK